MKTKTVSVTATVTIPVDIELEVPDNYNGTSEVERADHLQQEAQSIVSQAEIVMAHWDLQTSSGPVSSCSVMGDPEIIFEGAWVL